MEKDEEIEILYKILDRIELLILALGVIGVELFILLYFFIVVFVPIS